jgi:hypothetical protein
MHRYAWLELDGGLWHLLTHLNADPGESTRQWADEQRALEELMEEGWRIVRPYPENLPIQRQPGERLFGYGLTRSVH